MKAPKHLYGWLPSPENAVIFLSVCTDDATTASVQVCIVLISLGPNGCHPSFVQRALGKGWSWRFDNGSVPHCQDALSQSEFETGTKTAVMAIASLYWNSTVVRSVCG